MARRRPRPSVTGRWAEVVRPFASGLDSASPARMRRWCCPYARCKTTGRVYFHRGGRPLDMQSANGIDQVDGTKYSSLEALLLDLFDASGYRMFLVSRFGRVVLNDLLPGTS